MSQTFHDRLAAARASVPVIRVDEALGLQSRDDVVFLDPRDPESILATTGSIPGALVVPLADVAAGVLPEALADTGIRVVASCQAGPMAAIAAHELQKRGFRRVSYIEGGTQAWLDAGLSTTTRRGRGA